MARERSTGHPGVGAYAMRLDGGRFPSGRLSAVAPRSESWSLAAEPRLPESVLVPALGAPTDPTMARFEVHEDRATAQIVQGVLAIDRAARSAVLQHHDAELDPERLVHPTLAALGAVVAHWSGRAALHAGAVILGGQAWGIIAKRGLGKSTTLAALSAAGFAVLTDDLLVIDADLQAHVGPRCIDLRTDSAERFPDAVLIDDHQDRRPRFRLDSGPAPASAPVAGFIVLAWDDEATEGARWNPIAPIDRLPIVASSVTLPGLTGAQRILLDLATLPMAALGRPERLDSVEAAVEQIASVERLGPAALGVAV